MDDVVIRNSSIGNEDVDDAKIENTCVEAKKEINYTKFLLYTLYLSFGFFGIYGPFNAIQVFSNFNFRLNKQLIMVMILI